MGEQVGLKVQLASDFGKLSATGLGAVVKLVNRVDELEKENDRLREALKEIARPYEGSDIPVLSLFQMRKVAKSALEGKS